MLIQKQLKFCRKSYWKKQPFIFTIYLMNHIFQTLMELKELNSFMTEAVII